MREGRRYPPVQVEMEFGNGVYLFRLPLRLIAALQEARGARVTYPDGATGRRPKPLGQIWREHVQSGEYDPLDSVELIRLGLIGGAQGRLFTGEEVKVNDLEARRLVEEYAEQMPREDLWQFATAILIATCQGFVEEKKDAGEGGEQTEAGKPFAAPETEMTDSSTSPPQSETA